MIIDKEKIDRLLKNAKIGDRGYFNNEDGKEYCVAKKWKNRIGEYKNYVYLVSIEHIRNLKKSVKDELGVMVNAETIFNEYDYENLFTSEDLRIDTIRNIKPEDIWFEDGIIVENEIINALTNMGAKQVKEIFGLDDLKYEPGYYDVYLDYNPKNDSCKMTIVAVSDEDRLYYKYIPNNKEKEILVKALEDYTKSYEGKTIQELLEELEELEKE